VVKGSIGDPIETDSFSIEVLSARVADLPPEAGDPEPGTERIAITVSVINRRTVDVPLNAVPYGIYSTVLRVSDGDSAGVLVSGLRTTVREGVVPANAALTLDFLFEI
jgi:hypothetical protein